MKALFLPLSLVTGLLAGMASKKLFSLAWSTVDGHEPPDPKHRVESHGKLVAALLLEGAMSRLVRGAIHHASRHGFARMTGAWPGEESD